MRRRSLMLMVSALIAVGALRTVPADAGCGCNKPPPALSDIRPAFASPGDTVTLFSSKLEVGKSYNVRFGGGTSAPEASAVAVRKRDLADGVYKAMLEVAAPSTAVGPTRVRVYKVGNDNKVIVDVASNQFTMMQAPLALQEGDTETVATCYQAAVTADNTVLIPLDISAIDDHMIFNGLGDDYPLLFGADDIAIYNAQGFLMQLLGPEQAGIYAIDDPGQPGSMALTYDRHEFVTYRQQHAHQGGLGLDPADRRWHTDGTYHVDHDHLVIAIQGVVENQGAPAPGATPRFNLRIATALAEGSTAAPVTRTIQWSTACGASGNTSSNNGLVGGVVNGVSGLVGGLL